ncbi:hypothetical protein AMATHDRAFT_142259 [Amanita thiersii Skay4041]|uniref:Conserved oligomeric Golgi complex subunit 2 n=1 Tax=Amanita thiersii Skay4041 TaxID=703135 RepID=A0A2A9NTC5_9AGAR|nr:hypothetical protein AMATHDRAFT_142259 [Amanita thiersii Skay4041]
MSLHSPSNDLSSPNDPFRLDSLAEELAVREAASASNSTATPSQKHELPAYVPLSHDNPHLSAETFNVQEFLLSRSYTSLTDLRAELRDYHAKLKEELVQLINDDYEAFISLSTDLKGEGDRLQRIREPLAALREQVLTSRGELQVVLDNIQEKLAKRAALREGKVSSISRLESLLLIPSSDDDGGRGVEMNTTKSRHDPDAGEVENSMYVAFNRAKYLARVATEYTQLVYHASKAKSAFVDTNQWRIDRIKSTLSSDLDHVWALTLSVFTAGKATEIERSKYLTDMTECLRTYDTLELWRDAEEVIRKEVVRPFVKKTVFSDALNAPHSPIIPQTPFQVPSSGTSPLPTSLPLRTPYTPFTAFVSHQPQVNKLHSPDPLTSSPYALVLHNDEHPLAHLYTQMLRFVERNLLRIMEIAEKVSIKPNPGPSQDPNRLDVQNNEKGFNILANVIWDEFAHAILEELGHSVFSVGRPNEFRKHYELTRAFILSLEHLTPSPEGVQALHSHPSFSGFEKRWQLPVYYQLRLKEIGGKLDEALSDTLFNTSSTKIINPFLTAQATAVWLAISSCWSSEVFLPELSQKFWKLTLQILSKYKSWLDAAVHLTDITNAPSEKPTVSPVSISRSGTPLPPGEMPSAELLAKDDTSMRQFATAILDIKALCSAVMTLWVQEISMMLSETLGDEIASLKEELGQSLSTLTSLIQPMSDQIISILTRRCCEALLPVRSIPSQFRAMANKRLPTEPSYFVASMFRPVKAFFAIGIGEGPGSSLREEFLKGYATEVFEKSFARYIHYLTTMKKTEESLRRLKKGKKSTFSMFGNTSTKDDESRDEERIRAQMILDVNAFGHDASALGVDLEKSDSYKLLKEVVQAADSEQ